MKALVLSICLGLAGCGGPAATGPANAGEASAETASEPATLEEPAQPPTESRAAPQSAAPPAEEVSSSEAPEGNPPPPSEVIPVAPLPAQSPSQYTPPPPPPHVLVTIQNFNQELAASAQYRRLLEAIRRELDLPANREAPAVCTSGARQEVVAFIRQGHPTGSQLTSYRRRLDELCESFEHWNIPSDILSSRIQAFHTQLDRIENWMRDIHTCIDPGPYDARCKNAYGPPGGSDVRDAVAVVAVIVEVRTVLERAPGGRFPCHHPLWARLEARRWTQRIAQVQMPHVPGEVQRICAYIGVDTETLTQRVRRIRDQTAVDEANARQRALSLERSIAQLRQTYRLEE